MLSSFILGVFFATAVQAQELTCGDGSLVKVELGKAESQKAAFCFNKSKGLLFSKNCAKRNCGAFKKPERFTFKEVYSEYGTPGFEVCRRLGGNPEIITVKYANQSFPGDRCVFPNGDFVDTGSLYKFYLKK